MAEAEITPINVTTPEDDFHPIYADRLPPPIPHQNSKSDVDFISIVAEIAALGRWNSDWELTSAVPSDRFCKDGWLKDHLDSFTLICQYPKMVYIPQRFREILAEELTGSSHVKVVLNPNPRGFLARAHVRISSTELEGALNHCQVPAIRLYSYGSKLPLREYQSKIDQSICYRTDLVEEFGGNLFDISTSFFSSDVILFSVFKDDSGVRIPTKANSSEVYPMFGNFSWDVDNPERLIYGTAETHTALERIKLYPLIGHFLKATIQPCDYATVTTMFQLRGLRRKIMATLEFIQANLTRIGGFRIERSIRAGNCSEACGLVTGVEDLLDGTATGRGVKIGFKSFDLTANFPLIRDRVTELIGGITGTDANLLTEDQILSVQICLNWIGMSTPDLIRSTRFFFQIERERTVQALLEEFDGVGFPDLSEDSPRSEQRDRSRSPVRRLTLRDVHEYDQAAFETAWVDPVVRNAVMSEDATDLLPVLQTSRNRATRGWTDEVEADLLMAVYVLDGKKWGSIAGNIRFPRIRHFTAAQLRQKFRNLETRLNPDTKYFLRGVEFRLREFH